MRSRDLLKVTEGLRKRVAAEKDVGSGGGKMSLEPYTAQRRFIKQTDFVY